MIDPPLFHPWPTTNPAHGSVMLRRFRSSDAAMAVDLASDPYVSSIGSLPLDATMHQAHLWVERQQSRYDEGAGFSFAVVDRAHGRCVGSIGLWVRELANGRARIGYGIAPSFRRKNFATDALRAVTNFGWTIPTLQRVELYIEPWNAASIKTAERAGYLHEGLLRSHQEIAGKRCDMLLYSMIRQDLHIP